MEISLFVVADYANQTTNEALNVMGVPRRVIEREFPAVHRELYVVTQFFIEAAHQETAFYAKWTFSDPRNQEVELTDGPFRLPLVQRNLHFHNHVLYLSNFTFSEPGLYRFRLYIDEQLKATFPIEVEQFES